VDEGRKRVLLIIADARRKKFSVVPVQHLYWHGHR